VGEQIGLDEKTGLILDKNQKPQSLSFKSSFKNNFSNS
jgi:hypothetical protein